MDDIDDTKLEEFKKTKEYRRCASEVDLYKDVFVKVCGVLKDVKQQAKISDGFKLHVSISNKSCNNLRVYFEEDS